VHEHAEAVGVAAHAAPTRVPAECRRRRPISSTTALRAQRFETGAASNDSHAAAGTAEISMSASVTAAASAARSSR